MLFVVLVPLVLMRFLADLDARTRWRFVGSGAVFVAGALGLKLVEGILIEGPGLGSLGFTAALAVEEGLEMLGVALFLYASLDYLALRGSGAALSIRMHEPPKAPRPIPNVAGATLWNPQEGER